MSTVHSMATDFHPSALTAIYQPDITMAIWQRHLNPSITGYAGHLITASPHWKTRAIQKPQHVARQLERELPLSQGRQAFIEDVVQVVDMFSCLFELDHVGLRMVVLSSAMCPKFHVDRVPCRLICTYAGAGTEWRPPMHTERLDHGKVKPRPKENHKSLMPGDVALLKGEAWDGNEGRGLVHRSPDATRETPRLVLTLDFA